MMFAALFKANQVFFSINLLYKNIATEKNKTKKNYLCHCFGDMSYEV